MTDSGEAGQLPLVTEANLETLKAGGKAAVARALAALERAPDSAASLALLDAAYAAPGGQVLGITGPPGVGKSTLIGAVIRALRSEGRSVAVVAVDPSSKRSGGALLGDRTRFAADAADPGVFVRSMAARARLGGLAELTYPAVILLRALFDLVIVETVGVGQSETDVAGVADTVVFCVQPGSGDSLQFMKAGIVEIPQIAVVTKADLGAPARRALADLKGALGLAASEQDGWPVRCEAVAAAEATDIARLLQAVAAHREWLAEADRLGTQRQTQAEAWLGDALRERYGREGLAKAGSLSLAGGASPFRRLAEIEEKI
ncbi:MAG: ATP/GTP-binding protein [Kiloniellales bacterium]|nr:ATP/GTP-binding protein [Kiloniellales bacterium]